jgi:hypothetical protein
MYLFSRRAQLAPGNVAESIGWVTAIGDKVTQITGLPLGIYTHVFSPEVGTFSWTTFVEDLGELESANDKMSADQGFMDLQNEGAKHTTGVMDDIVMSIVHGEPDPDRQVDYVTSVETVCASGALAKGVELGVGIAQQAEKVTGLPTMFGMRLTGGYGTVGWLTGYADVAEMQAANEKLNGDASWLKIVDEGVKGVYVEDPASTQQRAWRRLV